jgi:hypothetical protein
MLKMTLTTFILTFSFFSFGQDDSKLNSNNQTESSFLFKTIESNKMDDTLRIIETFYDTSLVKAERFLLVPGVYIDSTEELGSFNNPYLVDSMLQSDPYVWFYNRNHGVEKGKGMYGLKEDMIEYAYNLINEIGKGIYDYDERGSEYRIEWDIVEDGGDHYSMILLLFENTAQLYINEYSKEEHIDMLKTWKYYYKKTYGKKKYKEWLAK